MKTFSNKPEGKYPVGTIPQEIKELKENAWQKCPVCEGKGDILNRSHKCPTCKGKRIISTITGKPPE